MRGIANYDRISTYSDTVKLPAGAYKVKILRAEEQSGANNSSLCILFDITEGEYKDYYRARFEEDKKNNPSEAKYKGVLRLWYPNGGPYDESAEKRMKTALENIKESNNLRVDFSKEWDGAVLKGCEVGMLFQDKEWEFRGKTGFTAQPYSIITLEALKEGKFTLPKPKYLKNGPSASSASFQEEFQTPRDDDLPF